MKTEKISLSLWEKTSCWENLIKMTQQAGQLPPNETVRLSQSMAAEIIAATAYISKCYEPERMIVSHWMTLIGAFRSNLFNHKPGETLAERLLPVAYYPEGDTQAIKAGMLLLELLSLNDHKHDLPDDIEKGKQNPLILELDYNNERNRILDDYEKLPHYIQDHYKNLFDRSIKCIFWG